MRQIIVLCRSEKSSTRYAETFLDMAATVNAVYKHGPSVHGTAIFTHNAVLVDEYKIRFVNRYQKNWRRYSKKKRHHVELIIDIDKFISSWEEFIKVEYLAQNAERQIKFSYDECDSILNVHKN